MEESKSTSPDRLQISVTQIFALVTFAALAIGVVTISFQARAAKRQLRGKNAELQFQIEDLQQDIANLQGGMFRTKYAEMILFQVVSNPEKYPELTKALGNYRKRKIGISAHGLDADDNLAYLNFYTMEDNVNNIPFCHSFLVQEEPFEVMDSIVGEQSRIPRLHEGKWVCGAGLNEQDRWFIIDNQKFNPLIPVALISQ